MPGEYDLGDFLSRPSASPLQHWRDKLAVHHADHAQRAMRASMAMGQIEEGLAELTRLGHHFHLAEGAAPPPEEWPRAVYHASRAPNGHTVLCQQDIDELGGRAQGWANTPQEAQQLAGLAKQLERGGVKVGQEVAPLGLGQAPGSVGKQSVEEQLAAGGADPGSPQAHA
jgi:hypothetical protein